MQAPLFGRRPTDAERRALEAGLRSPAAFTLRRCQIVLASARGETVPTIARSLGCAEQTVRDAIHAFDTRGEAALTPGSKRPTSVQPTFDAAATERLRALLHRSPRDFGHDTSLWTLELAAETAQAQGIVPVRVRGETVRMALKRLGIGWKRAKTAITSPDPDYARKKGHATV
jgi:transposase